jgi:hypothetical protein
MKKTRYGDENVIYFPQQFKGLYHEMMETEKEKEHDNRTFPQMQTRIN